MTKLLQVLIVTGIIVIFLSGCGSSVSRAPVTDLQHAKRSKPVQAAPASEKDWRPRTYVVQKGDTLYGIAFNYGLDYHDIAALNNIDNPNVIKIGQELQLFAPANTSAAAPLPAETMPTGEPIALDIAKVTTAPLPETAAIAVMPSPTATAAAKETQQSPQSNIPLISQPMAIKLPYSANAAAQIANLLAAAPVPVPTKTPNQVVLAPKTVVTKPAPAAPPAIKEAPVPDIPDDKIVWGMPTDGKLVAGFSEDEKRKGIDLAGKLGQPIVASAAGKIVYSGSGLRGYGNLIIIKHNKTYLSAYAHNDRILVREGESVSKGQKIAEMGDSDADRVELHFEIRKLGKPVDPATFLPMIKS